MTRHFATAFLNASIALFIAQPCLAQDSAPIAPTEPTQTDAAAGDVSPVAETAAVDLPASESSRVTPDHPDLKDGSFGVVTGDEKVTPQTSARIGFVGDTLHIMAARIKGGIFDPALDMHLALGPGAIKRVGLKRYGFNRQVHVDLGDRTIVFSLSGGAFVDAKGTAALHERLVASGVVNFKPKRFVGYPQKIPITIYY